MADIGFVDLHTHTTASDGVHPPAENVRMAKAAGLSGIAITDHDTVAGVAEALAEGKRQGIVVVPGVEVSTVEKGIDIHILGYYIDIRNPLLLERLQGLRRTRDIRNEMMIKRLGELGIDITMEDVLRLAAANKSADETVGRPHIAEALVRRGVVSTVSEAFDRYLGKNGAAYVNPPRIRPQEAIRWIREAGGKAVLAHPGIYGDDELVKDIVRSGVDGVEAYHSDHAPEQERLYAELAAAQGLIITAGSDFHGLRGDEALHGEIGNRRIKLSVLEMLRGSEG